MKRADNRTSRTGFGLVWLVVLVLAAGCGPKAPPLTELSSEELWSRGVEAFNEEDWDDALRYLDRFVVTGGSDPRIHQARYYVGQAHFHQEEYITAAAELSRLAADLGNADLADDARLMACRSYEALSPDPQLDQEYTRAAIEHCQALLDYFPQSVHREEATRIVDAMWGKLAEKVFETGDHYQRRRAYDSAIIYFEDVVDRYPQTRWAPRALARMVEIYGILEWEAEREEMRERLLGEYPESPEARAISGG